MSGFVVCLCYLWQFKKSLLGFGPFGWTKEAIRWCHFLFYIRINAMIPEKFTKMLTVRKTSRICPFIHICTKSSEALFWAETHPASNFCENVFSCFCVTLTSLAEGINISITSVDWEKSSNPCRGHCWISNTRWCRSFLEQTCESSESIKINQKGKAETERESSSKY